MLQSSLPWSSSFQIFLWTTAGSLAWMLQSSLSWSSSFQVFLWATAGLLSPLAAWPGQPGCCNPPALSLKPSSLSVGQSWFVNSLSILAWVLQSSMPWPSSLQVLLWVTAGLLSPLAALPGQPGCSSWPGPHAFKSSCGPQLAYELP